MYIKISYFLVLIIGLLRTSYINGQTPYSTTLNLTCRALVFCNKCEGKGMIMPHYSWPQISCPDCAGLSSSYLKEAPCHGCANSRKINDPKFTPPGLLKCQPCLGYGKVASDSIFQIADADFPHLMNWKEADEACNTIGFGWRLPTKQEFEGMYWFLHYKKKGNFKSTEYWSSTYFREEEIGVQTAPPLSDDYYWYCDFSVNLTPANNIYPSIALYPYNHGIPAKEAIWNKLCVRAVRSIY